MTLRGGIQTVGDAMANHAAELQGAQQEATKRRSDVEGKTIRHKGKEIQSQIAIRKSPIVPSFFS